MIVERIEIEPLEVRLREPFVIASARLDTTCATLVRVTLRDGKRLAIGLGEAAPLPPVTAEDGPTTFAAIERAIPSLVGRELAVDRAVEGGMGAVAELLAPLAATKVARAGVETALLDAIARLHGISVAELLSVDARPVVLETDVTLPIASLERMVHLALAWRGQGFRRFKAKIGKDRDHDVRALRAVHRSVPDATFRLDANEGFTADEALSLLRDVSGLVVECFEQPCRRDDLDGMAKVTREGGVPVIADESLRSYEDLETIVANRAAHGVNLKLVKLGGPLEAHRVGRAARARAMPMMCGAMVETRVGLVAMAQVCVALHGVELVDLDTAFLLADEPFTGGWTIDGPLLSPSLGPGLDVRFRGR